MKYNLKKEMNGWWFNDSYRVEDCGNNVWNVYKKQDRPFDFSFLYQGRYTAMGADSALEQHLDAGERR